MVFSIVMQLQSTECLALRNEKIDLRAHKISISNDKDMRVTSTQCRLSIKRTIQSVMGTIGYWNCVLHLLVAETVFGTKFSQPFQLDTNNVR